MNTKTLSWAAALVGFVAVLLYMTLMTMPKAPPTGVAHTAAAAAAECEEAVGESLDGARFPFSANPTYLGEATYRLNGTVETGAGGEATRQNYECYVHYSEAGHYLTDSLTVWQSH